MTVRSKTNLFNTMLVQINEPMDMLPEIRVTQCLCRRETRVVEKESEILAGHKSYCGRSALALR